MIEKTRTFSWAPWEDYSDKDLVKIARKYYKDISHPEKLKREELVFRLDSMDVDDLPRLFPDTGRVKNFFYTLWDRISGYIEKKRYGELW